MRIVLFINDSYFSFLLARATIAAFKNELLLIAFSDRIKGDSSRILRVLRSTYPRYFAYRSFIEGVSRLCCGSLVPITRHIASTNRLRHITCTDVNNDERLWRVLPADLGIAFNFDQILQEPLLNSFKYGVFNCHASKLPRDKGISPALWAFARGDQSIWHTIYRMDGGIDTGPIYRQAEIPVLPADTAFSLYERVCITAGEDLATLAQELHDGPVALNSPSPSLGETYNSWPDKTHKELMRRNKKLFLSTTDVVRALKTLRKHKLD